MRLEVACNATTGLVGAAAHCIYGPSDLYAAGYVDWKGFTVELIP